jgi:hypothetical protein
MILAASRRILIISLLVSFVWPYPWYGAQAGAIESMSPIRGQERLFEREAFDVTAAAAALVGPAAAAALAVVGPGAAAAAMGPAVEPPTLDLEQERVVEGVPEAMEGVTVAEVALAVGVAASAVPAQVLRSSTSSGNRYSVLWYIRCGSGGE